MTTTKPAPKIVKLELGQDVVFVMAGKPVLYIETRTLRSGSTRFDFTAFGLTERRGAGFYTESNFISGCSATLALDVQSPITIKSVIAAYQKRITPPSPR